MTYVLGLTGSIGMGKSTTARMFASESVPVWDADATVRMLYAKGGPAAHKVAQLYPDAMDRGAVSRDKLRGLIAQDPGILDHLQDIVHPLVAKDRADFLSVTTSPVVLLDIPLLFETGTDAVCDGVVVVTASADEQRRRVLERGEMSEADLNMILSRQMPDSEKRARADWVIETTSLDAARHSVRDILQQIKGRQTDA
ncbi:dephospho-CoA kinase [Pseudooctadecabacter sp.]|uniref:dephospho-CoA kinase n=1 Tax=Pseudooctadecabacter sp. TaxID=1966338 RepID=UPI0035C86DD0